MNKSFLALGLIALITTAQAQSYSPGLPLPGLPKSLGQKTMANSTSVTVASDQTPISVTGSFTATNPSVGTNGATAPTSSTQVGVKDLSGNLQALSIGANGITTSATIPAGVAITNTPTVIATIPGGVAITNTPIAIKDAVNTTGTGSAAAATVSTAITLSAPANAVGFVLQALDTNTANIRWAIGRTASATLGDQLQAGRDTGFVPAGANVSVCAESGTQGYDIQWVSQ